MWFAQDLSASGVMEPGFTTKLLDSENTIFNRCSVLPTETRLVYDSVSVVDLGYGV